MIETAGRRRVDADAGRPRLPASPDGRPAVADPRASACASACPRPAPTSGPGFDAFGLALGLYDDLDRHARRMRADGRGDRCRARAKCRSDESHLVVRSIRRGARGAGCVGRPDSRCGARTGSRTAVVSGRRRPRSSPGSRRRTRLAGEPVDRRRVSSSWRTSSKAIRTTWPRRRCGGFTIAWTEGETGRAVRLDAADGLRAIAYVPDRSRADQGGARAAAGRRSPQ